MRATLFALSAATLAAQTAKLAGAAPLAAAAAPPNFLFLMADQLRFDAISGAGNAGLHTPNLDRLAALGLRFSNAYSSTPTCTPARAAVLTGDSPWYHGMLGYGAVAPRYPFEMPRAMAAAGYYTASVGKDHFGWNVSAGTGYAHGYQYLQLYDGLGSGLPNCTGDCGEFDSYDQWFQTVMPGSDPLATGKPLMDWNSWNGAPYAFQEEYHPTAWVGRTAVQVLQNISSGAVPQPFFLKVSFHRPHSPYDPPERLLNATPASSLPPVRTGGNWDSRYSGHAGKPSGCGPSDPDAWCGDMPVANATLGRRGYHANIAFVDEQIGSILDTLNSTGLLDNTFILFVSDHGDGQGDHYLWRKGYPHEISAHVPMMLAWPPSYDSRVRIPRGSVTDLVTELRDICPTALDVASVLPSAPAMNGSSLLCLLGDASGASCNGGAGWRQWIDLEHDIVYNNSIHWNGLTDGKQKYVFWAIDGSEQLFDLTADPYEYIDVSGEPSYAAALSTWRQRMVQQFTAEGRGPAWVNQGKLQVRTAGQLYSPHYPANTAVYVS